MIKTICDFMIKEGTEQTTEGNYIFYFEELTEQFNICSDWLQDNADSIIESLELKEEVSQVDLGQDNSFSIYFNLGFCNIEIEEEF